MLSIVFPQAVFVEGHAVADGAFAQADVVFLAAGEIQEGRAIACGGHEPQVDLKVAVVGAGADAGFGFAVGDDVVDDGQFDECVADRGGVCTRPLGAGLPLPHT